MALPKNIAISINDTNLKYLIEAFNFNNIEYEILNPGGTEIIDIYSINHTKKFVAGEDILIHKPVRIVDGLVYHYDHENPAHWGTCVGIAYQSNPTGVDVEIVFGGVLDNMTFSSEGTLYVGSGSTLTTTLPTTGEIQVIGDVVQSGGGLPGEGISVINILKQNVLTNAFEIPLMACRSDEDVAVTNTYLQWDGLFMNLSPFIPKEAKTITGIQATSLYGTPQTWRAEIHDSGALIAGGFVDVSASDYAQDITLNIPITTASRIMLYCNGTGILEPRITIYHK